MATVKSTLRMFVVLLSVWLLAACGGGGGGGEDQQVQAQGANPVLVVAYGDSTQAGLSSATTEVLAPADVAQQVLRDKTGRHDITVLSAGVGHTTSTMLLEGRFVNDLTWEDRMRSSTAQIVTINHGINDSNLLRTTDDATYRANLTRMVSIAQALGKVVMLETPNPLVAGTALSARFDIPGVGRKAQIMREVAAATGASLCDEYAQIVAAGMDTLRWLPDGVHPHPALYEEKGKMLAACLLPLVGQ